MSAIIDDLQALRLDHPGIFERRKRELDAMANRDRQLAETVRRECADALRYTADAVGSPMISRGFIESAMKHLAQAKIAADALDPEPESA